MSRKSWTAPRPRYRARTKWRFPENMPEPQQNGGSFQALVINLLIAQMLSLCRAVELVQAISGIKLSDTTCPDYIRRIYDAIEPWEAAAKPLLTCPEPCR